MQTQIAQEKSNFTASESKLIVDKDSFERDGYILVKSVFPAKEIEELRSTALKLIDVAQKRNIMVPPDPLVPDLRCPLGDIFSKPGLDHILCDERILRIVRGLIGDDIAYSGCSSFQIGDGYRGFHKDCVDRTDPSGPDWQGSYDVIRLGIYFQNHRHYGGGVKFRKGSHLMPGDTKNGKIVDVPSEIGDVVAWKLTTTHSGCAVRFRFLPWVALPNSLERRMPPWLALPQQRARVSMFLTYGRPGPHFDRYIKKMVTRKDYIAHLQHNRYDQEVMHRLEQNKIRYLKTIDDYGSKYVP